MPALYPEAFARLKEMVAQLDKISHTLPGQAPGFVTDMQGRIEKYGERTYVTPKQKDWVESLYEKHVGIMPGDTAKGYGSSEEERRDLIGDDTDDEIPF